MERMFEITKIVKENYRTSTFFFKFKEKAEPGQFLMVWVPGSKEMPMSVSYSDEKKIAVTVAAVGEGSKALHAKKVGDYIGLRGPFGKPFTLKKGAKRIAMIGGGYGAAPLGLFAERNKGVEFHTFLGARKKEDLLFASRLKKVSEVHVSTDDGSEGRKGRVTEIFAQELKKKKFDLVLTCGPEMMEKAVFDICQREKLEAQVSIERLMKCGVGICGSCLLDDYIVCLDGPVFETKELKGMKEFGVSHRDKAGILEEF
ncbi:TPA: dihydroorotate dehydrogenase electron transfer subunit [archaeon]|nr:dihydroorotate dehydrogenase electron transfer subunit [Candidatus Naiadarchaeales archaeon SRR2090153.bin461]